jgi:hypothetical protein
MCSSMPSHALRRAKTRAGSLAGTAQLRSPGAQLFENSICIKSLASSEFLITLCKLPLDLLTLVEQSHRGRNNFRFIGVLAAGVDAMHKLSNFRCDLDIHT